MLKAFPFLDNGDVRSKRKQVKEVKTISETTGSKVENTEHDKKKKNNDSDDHKLLIAIAYNVQKLDSENESIVRALKQNNRYLHSILRHMKQLLSKQNAQLHEEV